MWFKDNTFFLEPKNKSKEKLENTLTKLAEDISKTNELNISSIVLDPSIRPSASNI